VFTTGTPTLVSGLSVSMTTNPGDMLVILLNVQMDVDTFVQVMANDTGTFAQVQNMNFGANASANGASVGYRAVAGSAGGTTVIEGLAYSNGTGGSQVNNATLTVMQFRP
jgi:hypothetical protein